MDWNGKGATWFELMEKLNGQTHKQCDTGFMWCNVCISGGLNYLNKGNKRPMFNVTSSIKGS